MGFELSLCGSGQRVDNWCSVTYFGAIVERRPMTSDESPSGCTTDHSQEIYQEGPGVEAGRGVPALDPGVADPSTAFRFFGLAAPLVPKGFAPIPSRLRVDMGNLVLGKRRLPPSLGKETIAAAHLQVAHTG